MVKEQRVRIVADSDYENPRTAWDCHAGRMICWHNRYNLGDDHDYRDPSNFQEELACEANDDLEEELDRLDDVREALFVRADENGCDDYDSRAAYANRFVRPRVDKLIDAALEGYVILPLYLMDHSGISMSVGSFGCPWDSGQVGWIICDKETIEKEFKGDRDLAEKCLLAEVMTYDDYLTGNVYGFIVEERDFDEERDEDDDEDWEQTDSCWGFYGSDVRENGMAGHLESEELIELAACADAEYPSY
jgi:hypothetical protein